MKILPKNWISDICLCGKKFTDRMEFYRHSAKCEDQKIYRLGSGETRL